MLSQNLQQALHSAENMPYKLIVLERESTVDALKTSDSYRLLNVSKTLAEVLLPLDKHNRRIKAQGCLEDLLDDLTVSAPDKQRVLDRIELLFEPSLTLQPLPLLKQLARQKPLIVLWPGEIRSGQLIYARPNHPEYQYYRADELRDVLVYDQQSL